MKVRIKMIKLLVSCLFLATLSFAQTLEEQYLESEFEPTVDCLILKDENSIICKFEAQRSLEDQNIIAQWIAPDGNISRSREMIVPAGHGSIYDYRYIKGRELGNWTFKIISNQKEYATQFELK